MTRSITAQRAGLEWTGCRLVESWPSDVREARPIAGFRQPCTLSVIACSECRRSKAISC